MTFGVLLVDALGVAVAADSLEVGLGAGAQDRLIRKAHGSDRLAGVASGVTRFGSVDLNEVLPRALEEPDLESAVRMVVEAAGRMLTEGWPTVRGLFGRDEVVWSAAIGSGSALGVPQGVVVTGYREGDSLGFRVRELRAVDGRTSCVVLGAKHPWLIRHDTDEAADLDLAARWFRDPDAPTGLAVGGATAAQAERLVVGALQTVEDADAPAWWPAGQPVAAGPVTSVQV